MEFEKYINSPLPFDIEVNSYYRRSDKLTIFDIGSCEGEDTIRLKKKFPNSDIYSFEPLAQNIQILRRNLKNQGIADDKVFELALSNDNGSAKFYVSSGHPDHLPRIKGWDYGNKSSSLLQPKEHKNTLKWVKFNKKIQVKTQRLDTFCKKHSITKIDIIYLDVQGAELMVLQGASKLLENVGVVWMEVEAIELYKGQPLKPDVEKFMERRNFIKVKDTVDQISGDQLYIKQGLKTVGFTAKVYSTIKKVIKQRILK